MGKAGENTLGRLSEVLFEELERLNGMDMGDREALELAILNARVTRARVALRKRVMA